jgi:hypothetical protein
MILGLTGSAGAGKSTAANYLAMQYGFVAESFASPIKDVVAAIFPMWPRELLEGSTRESRVWRELVDVQVAECLQMPGLTPRAVLQKVGTDLFRTHFHDYVISDVRFHNEAEWIRSRGGDIVRIDGGCDEAGGHTSEQHFNSIAADYVINNKGRNNIEALHRQLRAVMAQYM